MCIKSNQLKCILKVLWQVGLKPRLHKVAMSGSAYIKFGSNIGGSLRIGNHQQRSRYAYRWNLRADIKSIEHKDKLGHNCHYYPFADFDHMIKDMIEESKLKSSGCASSKNIIKGLV